MKLLAIALTVVLAGCSSSTAQYYEAVQKAAEANSRAAHAKYDALAKIAESGNGQAASAAVMALALTQHQTIAPVPQQSQALQWASILAAPLSNLGMMYMQTDSTKAMAEYNRDVSLARISADSVNQQALYGAFTDQAGLTASVANGALDAMGSVDYTPWINGLVDLGKAGITGVENVGLGGINAVADVGLGGISGLGAVSNAGFGALVDVSQDNNDFVTGIVTQYNATINNFIDNPLTNTTTTTTNTQTTVSCSVDASGVVTCQ